ncbi:MAG: polysaccharide deacetylase family protein, partial [Acidobacteriota bacterium]|nr:polysaccharide deacetylase family protein [Acidobacteriota bacterium]
GGIVVLMFHRILNGAEFEESLSLRGMKVRGETFEQFWRFLQSFCEVADPEVAGPGQPSGKLRVMLTFDDGWADNAPILERLPQDTHPIVFICPGMMNSTAPFWPERLSRHISTSGNAETAVVGALAMPLAERGDYLESIWRTSAVRPFGKMDRTMAWEQVLDLARRGVRFGSHTQTHQQLAEIGPDAAAEELRLAKYAIEAALGGNCDLFAYPNGSCSDVTDEALRRGGVRRAFTTAPGVWLAETNPLAIPRMNVSEENLAGPAGHFSKAITLYTLIWRGWRASRQAKALPAVTGEPIPDLSSKNALARYSTDQ